MYAHVDIHCEEGHAVRLDPSRDATCYPVLVMNQEGTGVAITSQEVADVILKLKAGTHKLVEIQGTGHRSREAT